jgi:hypothetical protein
MYRHNILALALLTCTPAVVFGPITKDPMIINHRLIDVIDHPNIIKIRKMMLLETKLLDLRNGKKGEYMLSYKGEKHSLRDLVAIEKKLTRAQTRQLAPALTAAIEKFQAITADYLEDAQGRKSQMCSIIEAWAKQRGVRTDLSEWSRQEEGQEMQGLRQIATSLAKMDQLIHHLITFLSDLRHSCKKQWTAYQKGAQRR